VVSTIEKLLFYDQSLYIGSVNRLHKYSSQTLKHEHELKLGPYLDSPQCRPTKQCQLPQEQQELTDYHFKLFHVVTKENYLLICGTLYQGTCSAISLDTLSLLINSTIPVVANDPVNSSVSVIADDILYAAVTYTNYGSYRWLIPQISGRSLKKSSSFMQIVTSTRDSENQAELSIINKEELSLKFMQRHQQSFIVQYIHSFITDKYVYLLSVQRQDINNDQIGTKLIRFCLNSMSIMHSYTELPIQCGQDYPLLKFAQTMKAGKLFSSILNSNQDDIIIIGHFKRAINIDDSAMCVFLVRDIDNFILDNYRSCYADGRLNRGLGFIKQDELCRKDEMWSSSLDNLCSISDRLPYPVGGRTALNGRILWENSSPLSQNITAVQLFHIHDGNQTLIVQGLSNGTIFVGTLNGVSSISWFSVQNLSSSHIHSEIAFDEQTATFFIVSNTHIYRLSFENCSKSRSCDECLLSENPFCSWCQQSEQCTLQRDCSGIIRDRHQCIQILNIQPSNASVDQSQWINLTMSKLPSLEHLEVYQCLFDSQLSTNAIKLDHNRLSCPTPYGEKNSNIKIQNGYESIRLSVIKSPSNQTIATVSNFQLYNCSQYDSCLKCRQISSCQWCFSTERCSSICPSDDTKSSPQQQQQHQQCSFASSLLQSPIFIESNKIYDLQLKVYSLPTGLPLCHLNNITTTLSRRVNETSIICPFVTLPELTSNEQIFELSLSLNVSDVNHDQRTIGIAVQPPVQLMLYRCDLYDTCQQCHQQPSCSWCQGHCAKSIMCNNRREICTSLFIDDIQPLQIPVGGGSLITITLKSNQPEQQQVFVTEITLVNIPCQIVGTGPQLVIQCRSGSSNDSRRGLVVLRLNSNITLVSKQSIAYYDPQIVDVKPSLSFQSGGVLLHVYGSYLNIGSSQDLYINGDKLCPIQEKNEHLLTCLTPQLKPNQTYSIQIKFDNSTTTIVKYDAIKITPDPQIIDIDPTVSFTSGGRLITVRGMFFSSAQSIIVELRILNWSAKLKIPSSDIIVDSNTNIESFRFRTLSLPISTLVFNNSISNQYWFQSSSYEVDVNIYFDSTVVYSHIISFTYLPDVQLNISSHPPVLQYTGEELKVQVENLTDAASIDDIEVLIACTECQLHKFTSHGITCQPPSKLPTTTTLVVQTKRDVNNDRKTSNLLNSTSDSCSYNGSTLAPIHLRIGYREHLIGYLSYVPRSKTSTLATVLSLIGISCLITILLLIIVICLFLKLRQRQHGQTEQQKKSQLWSTTTSASTTETSTDLTTVPYYQVYEQIGNADTISRGGQDNWTRTSSNKTLLCQYHQQTIPTPTPSPPSTIPFLTTIVLDQDHLKQILIPTNIDRYETVVNLHHPNRIESLRIFYSLLKSDTFSSAFIYQVLLNNSLYIDFIQCYLYVIRYDHHPLESFFLKNTSLSSSINTDNCIRHLSLTYFFSTLIHSTCTELHDYFHIFDDFIRILIDYLDSSPCDQLLSRSMRSLSYNTLLPIDIQYRSLQLQVDYDDLVTSRINVPVLDIDTIDQLRLKIVRYINAYQLESRIKPNDIELYLNQTNTCTTCSCNQELHGSSNSYPIPILRNRLINSTTTNCSIRVKKRPLHYHHCSLQHKQQSQQQNPFSASSLYHLCPDSLVQDVYRLKPDDINERLLQNKLRLQPVIDHLFQKIYKDFFLLSNNNQIYTKWMQFMHRIFLVKNNNMKSWNQALFKRYKNSY
ncbi:unnamed protein product, partial [Didymodactylos carnosus]